MNMSIYMMNLYKYEDDMNQSAQLQMIEDLDLQMPTEIQVIAQKEYENTNIA